MGDRMAWTIRKSAYSGWWRWTAIDPRGIKRSGSAMTRWGARREAKAHAGEAGTQKGSNDG